MNFTWFKRHYCVVLVPYNLFWWFQIIMLDFIFMQENIEDLLTLSTRDIFDMHVNNNKSYEFHYYNLLARYYYTAIV